MFWLGNPLLQAFPENDAHDHFINKGSRRIRVKRGRFWVHFYWYVTGQCRYWLCDRLRICFEASFLMPTINWLCFWSPVDLPHISSLSIPSIFRHQISPFHHVISSCYGKINCKIFLQITSSSHFKAIYPKDEDNKLSVVWVSPTSSNCQFLTAEIYSPLYRNLLYLE